MPLTEMIIDTGTSDPVSQKPLPDCNEKLSMGKRRDREIIHSKGHLQQSIQLVCTNHCSS